MTTLRVGVIGVGHLGKEHARILSGLSGVNLAGVADVNAAQAEAIALRCGTKPHSDYRTLLDGIDAAVVAVPTCHHHAVAADVLGRGIPTLVEKPLASTPDEAEELLALSRAKHVLLQVGHVERFNPAFEALQQRPLTPKYVFGERSGGYTGRSTDIGVVLDLMIHDIDLVLALVKSSVARVEALGLSVLGGPEDVATARLVFDNGCLADLRASRLAAAPVRQMQVWGQEGFARVDFAQKQLTLTQPSSALCQHRSGRRPFDAATQANLKHDLFGRHLQTLELTSGPRDQLTNELEEFVRCVRTGDRPRVTAEEGRTALDVAGRILDSIQQHSWDGIAGNSIGPNAFALPPAQLFLLPESGLAA